MNPTNPPAVVRSYEAPPARDAITRADPDGPLPGWMGGDGPRPTAVEGFDPTPVEEAYILARWLARDGIAAAPKVDYGAEERDAFLRGFTQGWAEFEADEMERRDDEREQLAIAYGDPFIGVDPDELIRARCASGHPASD